MGSGFSTGQSAPRLAERSPARYVGIAPYRGISPLKPLVPLVGVPVSRRGGLCTPAMSELASPGHVPARPPHLGLPPWRGGLRTPATTAQRQLQRWLPLATGSWSTHVVEMKCLGASSALPCGRGDRAPPRKPPIGPSPGLPPQGQPSSDSPPPGGAGSARPQRWQCLHRKITPLGRPAFYAPMIMLSLGLRPGRIRGRAERVPCMYNTLAVG